MEPIKIKLGTGNRFTIPKELCKSLGFNIGDTLYADIQDGNLILSTKQPKVITSNINTCSVITKLNTVDTNTQETKSKTNNSRIIIKSNLEDKGKFKNEKYSDCGLVIRTKNKYIDAFCEVCKGQLIHGDTTKCCRYSLDKSTSSSNYCDNDKIIDSNIKLKDELKDILNNNKVITTDIYNKLSNLNTSVTSNIIKEQKSVKIKSKTNTSYYRSSNTMLKPVKLNDYDSCAKCGLLYNKGFLIDDTFYCKDCTVQDFKNYINKLK